MDKDDFTIPDYIEGTLYATMYIGKINSIFGSVGVDTNKYDMSDYMPIADAPFKIHLPPVEDIRDVLMNGLQKKKNDILATATKDANDIQHRIDDLLQIEYDEQPVEGRADDFDIDSSGAKVTIDDDDDIPF